jgi:hypothetical protein
MPIFWAKARTRFCAGKGLNKRPVKGLRKPFLISKSGRI